MDLATLDDRQLLDHQGELAAARRRIDAELAAVAAEIAYRSRRELGHEGLAQRLGARTAERLVQQVAQVSARDAGVMVRVGALSGPVATAVADGCLSLDAADAIRAIATPALEEQLIRDAADLPPDRLAAHAVVCATTWIATASPRAKRSCASGATCISCGSPMA